jgi:translocation and assembly module TamA
LKVAGVNGELEHNIRAYASIEGEPCDAPAWLVRRRYRTLEKEVREALEPFGYYQPRIESTLSFEGSCWTATVTIEPGEPVRYRNVVIAIEGEAHADPAFDRLIDPPPIAPGQTVRHAIFDDLKRSLQITAADRGYVDADFSKSELSIWPEDGIADASLVLDSGARYAVGEIRVEQDILEQDLVAGYLQALEPGKPFDSRDLNRAYRELSDSGYFSRIDVSPMFDEAASGRIPIHVGLTPGNRIEYTVGVGASTDTGLRFRAGYRNNRLNTEGHRIIADLGVSPVVQGLTAEYRIPLDDPRREWFSFTAAVSAEDTDTFQSDVQRLGVRWTRALSQTWLRTFSVDFSNESFAIGEDVDTRRSIVPAASFDHKLADRDIFPRNGRRLGIEFRGTDRFLFSQHAYLRTSVWARWIRTFGDDNRLLLRFNAGSLTTDSFDQLPPSVRFFAGGDESVRGFDYESLGPRDEEGNVIGGRRLLVGSVEYERHLKGNFYGALFVDAGNAFDGNDFDAAVGTGPGIKWISPLGPIRFYVGVPLTGDDTGIRFHLRLGADL